MKTNVKGMSNGEEQNPNKPLKEQERNIPPAKERNDNDFHHPEVIPQHPGQEGDASVNDPAKKGNQAVSNIN